MNNQEREEVVNFNYTWEEAFEIAVSLFGYPCGCDGCKIKYGEDCVEQVFSLTKELSGQDFPPEGWRG